MQGINKEEKWVTCPNCDGEVRREVFGDEYEECVYCYEGMVEECMITYVIESMKQGENWILV